jgi:hypothetical protein
MGCGGPKKSESRKCNRRDSVISFVIPAHNEEALLGRTRVPARFGTDLGEPFEVLVIHAAVPSSTSTGGYPPTPLRSN